MKKTILYAAALLISATTIAQIPTDGLVAHYPFNGNANDESTNSNNGTVSGATLTEDRFGNANNAYHFDGSSYITMTDLGLPIDSAARTVCVWTKEEQSAGNMAMVSYGLASNGNAFYLQIQNSDFSRQLRVNTSGITHQSSQTVEFGDWHLQCAIVDNDSVLFYSDGVKIGSEVTGLNTILNGEFRIGSQNVGASNINTTKFRGVLDDVRIYDRGLSESEIKKIYYNDVSCTQVTYDSISVTDTLNIYLSQITTSVNDASQAATTIKVYPNPTAKDLTVSIDNYTNLSGVTIKVLDAQSVEVHNEVVTSATQSIDVSSWTAGIYFLHVMNGSTTVDVKKIVVNN